MQRIDEHPHGDATGSCRGKRRLHGTPDIIVERHVHLQVYALPARFDRRQQPAPRLLVVQFHFDSVAGDRVAGGGHVEPRGYGCGNGERAAGRRRKRDDLIRANRGKSRRRRLMRSTVDDGDDWKSGAAHPRRGAGEPHRVHLHRHIERFSFSEHCTGIDDAGRKARGPQFRAQRRAASDRTYAHPNGLRPRRPADQGQLVPVDFGVEQDKTRRASPKDRHARLNQRQSIRRVLSKGAKHTQGRSDTGRQLHLSASAGCLRHDLLRPDERDILIGDGRPTSNSHGVLEARADERTVIHQVWHVDRSFPFACRRAERGKDEHRWP